MSPPERSTIRPSSQGRQELWVIPFRPSKASSRLSVTELYPRLRLNLNPRYTEKLTFHSELALQRVEVQHNLSLSRQIGTPNIASKGKLAPRTALVPLALFPVSHALRANAAANQKKLIEEVNVAAEATRAPSSRIAEPAKPKGILKNGTENPTQVPTQGTPKFEWTKDDRCIQIRLQMPGLVGRIPGGLAERVR